MASRNIFESVFNPSDNSSPFAQMTGTLGKMMGVPNDAQIQGQANAQVNQELSQLAQQNGGNLQKAVLDFYSSPQGLELGSRDPQGMASTVKQWVSNATAPNPQLSSPGQIGTDTTALGGTKEVSNNPPLPQQSGPGVTTRNGSTGEVIGRNPYAPMTQGPGSGTIDPNTRQTLSTQPTTQFQTTKSMVDASGVDKQQGQDIYRQQVQTVEGRKGQAVDELVRSGQLDPILAGKFKAEALEFKEDKDAYGQGTGIYRLYDKLSGGIVGGSPAIQNLDPSLTEQGPAKFDPANPNHTMHLGSGMFAWGSGVAGQTARMVTGPTKSADDAASLLADQRRQEITRVQSSLADLQNQSSGLGIAEAKVKRMVANGPSLDMVMDPQSNLNRMIDLHSDITREISAEKRLLDRRTPEGGQSSIEAKKQANERIIAYERVLRALPPGEVLAQAKAACESGNCGKASPTPASLINQGKDILQKGSKEGSKLIKQETGQINPADVLGKIPQMDQAGLLSIDPTVRRNPEVRDAIRARNMQLHQSGQTLPGQALPYVDEPAANPNGVQNFIRNPDGSTSAQSSIQSRIDQAFKDLRGPTQPEPKRRSAPKRRQ